MSIKNSKNTISNSFIKVGQSINIGDIIDTHIQQKEESNPQKEREVNVDQIKTLISQGSVEEAIDLLLRNTKSKNNGLFNEVVIIARQWEEMQQDVRIGLISTDDKYRLASKITFGLLAVIDKIDD